jgi:hypothetical protein
MDALSSMALSADHTFHSVSHELVKTWEAESVLHVPEIVMGHCRLHYTFPEDLLHTPAEARDDPHLQDVAVCLATPLEKIQDDDILENAARELRTQKPPSYLERTMHHPQLSERYLKMLQRRSAKASNHAPCCATTRRHVIGSDGAATSAATAITALVHAHHLANLGLVLLVVIIEPL